MQEQFQGQHNSNEFDVSRKWMKLMLIGILSAANLILYSHVSLRLTMLQCCWIQSSFLDLWFRKIDGVLHLLLEKKESSWSEEDNLSSSLAQAERRSLYRASLLYDNSSRIFEARRCPSIASDYELLINNNTRSFIGTIIGENKMAVIWWHRTRLYIAGNGGEVKSVSNWITYIYWNFDSIRMQLDTVIILLEMC